MNNVSSRLTNATRTCIGVIFGLSVQWGMALSIDAFRYDWDLIIWPSVSLIVVAVTTAEILRLGDRPKQLPEEGYSSWRRRNKTRSGAALMILALLAALSESALAFLLFVRFQHAA